MPGTGVSYLPKNARHLSNKVLLTLMNPILTGCSSISGGILLRYVLKTRLSGWELANDWFTELGIGLWETIPSSSKIYCALF